MWTNMTEPQVLNPKKLSEVFGGGGGANKKQKWKIIKHID